MMAVAAAGCDRGAQPKIQNPKADESQEEHVAHCNPVFSLFDIDGHGTYHVYRNGEKAASLTLGDGRVPIGMCTQNGDCYILVSESHKKSPNRDTDTTSAGTPPPAADSPKWSPAEIYKNGRRAMVLDDRLHAISFDMDEGHFYVLGKLGDSVYTVYRDGQRVINYPARQDGEAVDMAVFQQSVYVARQRGKSIDVYNGDKKLYSLAGKCRDLKVSLRGVYVLVDDSLYLDRSVIMHDEYYRKADKELYAKPTMIAVSEKNVLVGGRAAFDKKHTYACIFQNQQAYATIKPDSKNIGESDLSTRCCGVAVSDETMYYATTILSPDMKQESPSAYYIHTDHSESYVIKFEDSDATLLMMASD